MGLEQPQRVWLSVITTISVIILIVTIITTNIIDRSCSSYYLSVADGFWTTDKQLIYIDTAEGSIRVMDVEGDTKIVAEDKLMISLVDQRALLPSSLTLSSRKYKITPKDAIIKVGTALGKAIQAGEITIEIYGAEGVLIVSDTTGDLMTMTMDVIANLEML